MIEYYKKIKQKAYNLLNAGWFVSLILALIFLNIPLSLFSLSGRLSFDDIIAIEFCDLIITIVFSFEYILRLWTADLSPDYHGSRIRFALRPAMIIDFLAIVPMVYINIKPLRTLRFLRLFRILKLVEYSRPLKLMFGVIYQSLDSLVTVGFVMGFLLTINSFLIYYFEHSAQPEVFKNIYDAIWFTAMTFCQAGAEISVVTEPGRLLKIITAFCGIMLFAVYSGIFSSGFMNASKADKENKEKCRKSI